jgi:hypothetical protein
MKTVALGYGICAGETRMSGTWTGYVFFHPNEPDSIAEVIPDNSERLQRKYFDPKRVVMWQRHFDHDTTLSMPSPSDRGVLCQGGFDLAKWQMSRKSETEGGGQTSATARFRILDLRFVSDFEFGISSFVFERGVSAPL